MFHYQESVTNIRGDALIGYFVKVVDMSDGSVVDIYADEAETPIESVSDVENAAEVNADGMVDFYVTPGNYHVDIYGTDASTFIRRISDVEMGIADADYGDVVITNNGDTWTVPSIGGTTVSAFAKTILDDADAAAVRTTLGIVSASDALLSSIAGLTFGADSFIYGTDTDTAAAGTVTAFARTILDDADQATARTTLGVGTGDSPQFTAINLGDASDTTITRTSAGNIAVEGNAIYRAGGTDVPLADGGTGASTAVGARSNLGLVLGTAAEYRANTADRVLVTDDVWSAADYVALADSGGNIAVDLSSGLNFTMTMDGDYTLSAPSNGKPGQTGCIIFTQDGTGTQTLAYNAAWKFADGSDPVLSTAASSVDILFYQVLANGTDVYANLVKAIA
jgi:hypothetical protein